LHKELTAKNLNQSREKAKREADSTRKRGLPLRKRGGVVRRLRYRRKVGQKGIECKTAKKIKNKLGDFWTVLPRTVGYGEGKENTRVIVMKSWGLRIILFRQKLGYCTRRRKEDSWLPLVDSIQLRRLCPSMGHNSISARGKRGIQTSTNLRQPIGRENTLGQYPRKRKSGKKLRVTGNFSKQKLWGRGRGKKKSRHFLD